jgi:uncharacterized protein
MKHRIKTLCASGLLALALFGVASAGQLEDGLAAAQRGDFAAAIELWRPLANKGDADALYNLGMAYCGGRGVPEDRIEGEKLVREPADRGNADAQEAVGIWFEYGEGVPQDIAQAILWFRKAADQGLPRAQARLGRMYSTGMEFGMEVPRDVSQAALWSRRAADQGNPNAQAKYGARRGRAARLRAGLHVAEFGSVWWEGLRREVRVHVGAQHVADKMTPAQIAEAQRMAPEAPRCDRPVDGFATGILTLVNVFTACLPHII